MVDNFLKALIAVIDRHCNEIDLWAISDVRKNQKLMDWMIMKYYAVYSWWCPCYSRFSFFPLLGVYPYINDIITMVLLDGGQENIYYIRMLSKFKCSKKWGTFFPHKKGNLQRGYFNEVF